VITTQRFLLRPLIADDVGNNYLSWLNTKEIVYIDYVKNHSTMEELKAYVSERENRRNVLFLEMFTKKRSNTLKISSTNPLNIKGK